MEWPYSCLGLSVPSYWLCYPGYSTKIREWWGNYLHSHNALSFIAAVRLLCLYWLSPRTRRRKRRLATPTYTCKIYIQSNGWQGVWRLNTGKSTDSERSLGAFSKLRERGILASSCVCPSVPLNVTTGTYRADFEDVFWAFFENPLRNLW